MPMCREWATGEEKETREKRGTKTIAEKWHKYETKINRHVGKVAGRLRICHFAFNSHAIDFNYW